MLATIIAAFAIGFPVSCSSGQQWENSTAHYFPNVQNVAAYYVHSSSPEGATIVLGPLVCTSLREFTRRRCDRGKAWFGVFVLGHELRHREQDLAGRPFDEAEADALGLARTPWMFRVLERAFGVKCFNQTVTLAPFKRP